MGVLSGKQEKYGQINFFFASSKLNKFHHEVKEFDDFLKKFKFIDKRNEFISHKKLPPTWDEHVGEYRIPYVTILRGISHAPVFRINFLVEM